MAAVFVRAFRFAVVAAAIFAVLPVRVCLAIEPHVLRFADGMDVSTLNPWYATTANIMLLSELTMAKFSRFDREGRLVPELVVEIPSRRNRGISNGGRTVTWHLRHDARWSDGAPFDAQDVLFTIAAVKNSKNAFATHGGTDNIVRATAPDRYTVVMTLEHSDSDIDQLFSTYGFECILPRHLLHDLASLDKAAYNALPVGIGPFRYVRFTRGTSVIAEANPNYFRGMPKLKRVEYLIIPDVNTLVVQMQSGEVDLWPGAASLADRLAHLRGLTVARHAGPAVHWLEFNVRRPLVADRRVRNALRLALDRHALLVDVLHGYGTLTDALVPPMRTDADPSLPLAPYDPAGAKRLLDIAGWHPGPDGIRVKGDRRLSLRLIAQSGSPAAQTLVELVRDAWQRVGVSVDTRLFAIAQFFAPAADGGPISAGNFDVALAGGDPYSPTSLREFLTCASAPPNGLNDSRYCNPSVDAGIARAAGLIDVPARRRELRRVQVTIANDAPLILAYRIDDVVAYGRRVVGYRPTPLTFLDDMMNVDTR